MSIKKAELRLDPAKLRNMKGPFLVRVEKMRGSSRMPIELPVRGDGLSPGEGWDQESILKIDNWLATEWSGGGVYRILIVDQDGDKMEWESVFDPRTFPEKTPPSMAAVPPAVPVMQQIQQAQQPQQGGSVYGAWPPPAWSTPPPVASMQPGAIPPYAAGQPQQQFYGPTPPGNGNGNGNGWGYRGPSSNYPAQVYPPQPPPSSSRRFSSRPWSESPMMMPPMPPSYDRDRDRELERERQLLAERERQTQLERERQYQAEKEQRERAAEQERRVFQEQLAKMERDRIEAEHKAALERTQQEHRAQMAALQEEIRRIGEKAATPPPGPSPEMEQLKAEREQMRLTQERMERERERDKLDQRFMELQQLIAQSAQAAQQAAAQAAAQAQAAIPKGPDPELLALKEAMRLNQEKSDRERERLEAERRRDQERMDAERRMAEIREEARQREAQFQRQLELLQTQPKGPDPMITIMQQSISQQVDAVKDIIRQQQTASDRMASYMMAPRDVIALVKDQGSGLDDLRKTLSSTYTDIFNTQKMVVEHAMQLAGGGGPSLGERVLETGLARAGDLAERYLAVQRDRSVSDAKARQAQAEAMARMAASQQQVHVPQQPQQPQQQRPSPAAQQMAAQAQAQAQAAARAQAQAQAQQQAQQAAQAQAQAAQQAGGGLNGPVVTSAPDNRPMGKVIQLRRHGHTDSEWFGPALPEIEKLRAGVAAFLKSIGSDPPNLDENGNPVGYGPDQCAKYIIIGANRISGMQLAVKAFTDLFAENRFADFVDVILPDAPQLFRDDVVQALLGELTGTPADPDVDDADDVDENDVKSEGE